MNKVLPENQEMISLLQRYLMINTSHPKPDYSAVCDLFKRQAEQDTFACEIITTASGNPTIIITYNGTNSNLPSLILNHHMDVVPALNTHNWVAPPFSGAIINDTIIGRGAQDTKGLGIVHYSALKTLKTANIQLARTVHLVIVPDEEIGGFTGTKEFIETDFFKTMNVGYVIDEGVPSSENGTIAIKVSERRPLQIKITTTGSLAHGSKLNCFNASHELINILHEITSLHGAQQKESIDKPDGLLLSANVTSLSAGIHSDNHITLNIVPESASATVDIRIPPTIVTNDVIHILNNIIARYPNSTYTILAAVPDQQDYSGYETPLYNALKKTINELNLQSKPLFFEATTDLRYYKHMGIDGIGCTPFTVQDNIHGTNESVTISDLIQAKNIMIHFLKNFCV